ncbi:MAG: DMT family transporter [Ruminococcaceae bacterium]|nr:DMT family transporter [Oscillospiraceae bacterium]
MKLKNIKSLGILLLTAMIWGFAFVAQRVGAEHVGAFTFNGIRFALGAASLIPVIMIFEKKEKEAVVHSKKMKQTLFVGLVAGIVLFVASWLQQWGIEVTGSAGKGGFITGLYTVLVPLFGILLGKKTGLNVWIGAVFAVVGLFLLCITDKWQLSIGDGILLIGSVFWAIHILVIDGFGNRIYSLRFACTQFVVCAVFSLVCAFVFECISLGSIKPAVVPILYGGLMSVGVAYTCQIIGQKNADPTFASIILSTESMFAAIGGAIILHETMTANGYWGCALIFIGIILSQITLKPRKN